MVETGYAAQAVTTGSNFYMAKRWHAMHGPNERWNLWVWDDEEKIYNFNSAAPTVKRRWGEKLNPDTDDFYYVNTNLNNGPNAGPYNTLEEAQAVALLLQ